MFDKLLSWLREKARLWFGEDTPISVSVSAPMESAITLWAQMYDTGGPWCHGGKDPLHSLGLPQSIAAELARLTTLEMECLVSGSARADSIHELLNRRDGLMLGICSGPLLLTCAFLWSTDVLWAGCCSGPTSTRRAASRLTWCRETAFVPPTSTAPDV